MQVIKYGVNMPFSLESLEIGKQFGWGYKASHDARYKRELVSKTWVPTPQDTVDKYNELTLQLNKLHTELETLGAEQDYEDGSWTLEQGHYDYVYSETEEEWKARCEALDA